MRIIQSDNPRPLTLLAFGPGGLVATASDVFGVPGYAEVWYATTAALAFDHRSATEVGAIAFTPDGRYLIVADTPRIAVLDVAARGRVWITGLEGEWARFALAATGTRVVTAAAPRTAGAVECFALDDGLSAQQLWSAPRDGPSAVDALEISSDGARVAVAERFESSDGRPQRELTVRDAETGAGLVSVALDAADPVRQLAFTADGAKLLVRTESRTVAMFDVATGAPAGELVHVGRPYVTGVAIHPRGPVACVRTHGTVTFWDTERREQLRTLDWKAGRLVSVAFSPDGALAAAGTEDGKVVVWDVDL